MAGALLHVVACCFSLGTPARASRAPSPHAGSLPRRQVLLQLPAGALALCAAARPAGAAAGSAVVRDDAGFRSFDFRTGEGAQPRWGQLLTIYYAGYIVQADGSLRCFDSSFARNEPYLLKHGNGQTIKGLELALHTMREGGRRRVVLPQETLGFNLGALGPLPAGRNVRESLQDEINAVERSGRAVDLVWDVELVSVMDDALDRGLYDDATISTAEQESDAVTVEELLRRGARGQQGPPV